MSKLTSKILFKKYTISYNPTHILVKKTLPKDHTLFHTHLVDLL